MMNKITISNIGVSILIGITSYNFILPIVLEIEDALSDHFDWIQKRLFKNGNIFANEDPLEICITLSISVIIALAVFLSCPFEPI